MTIDLPTAPLTGGFTDRWYQWHSERVASVTAPFGTASLVSTTWLTSTATSIDGAPGRWRADGPDAVGTGLLRSGYRDAGGNVADEVRLPAGRTITDGIREIRGFARDGRPAARLLDSTAPGRTTIAGIDAYEADPSWCLPARVEPGVEPRRDGAVDGLTRRPNDRIVFTRAGREYRLVARRTERGFAVVFGDATNGSETYRFRFLTVAPADDGTLVVDFNRAYLPPCAFSDQYLCPLPSPENLLPLAVRAGERSITRTRT